MKSAKVYNKWLHQQILWNLPKVNDYQQYDISNKSIRFLQQKHAKFSINILKVFNKYFQSFQNKTTKQSLEQKKNKDNVEPKIAWKANTGIQGWFSTVLRVHKTLAAQMTLMAPVTMMVLMAPMNLVAHWSRKRIRTMLNRKLRGK